MRSFVFPFRPVLIVLAAGAGAALLAAGSNPHPHDSQRHQEAAQARPPAAAKVPGAPAAVAEVHAKARSGARLLLSAALPSSAGRQAARGLNLDRIAAGAESEPRRDQAFVVYRARRWRVGLTLMEEL